MPQASAVSRSPRPASRANSSRRCRPRILIPQPEAADEGIGVRPRPAPRRQALQLLGISSAEHHLVGVERLNEAGHGDLEMLLPLLPAGPAQSPDAEIALVGAALERQ